VTPALSTATSTGPNSAIADFTASLTATESATSTRNALAHPLGASPERDSATTWSPWSMNHCAIAAPMRDSRR